MRMRTSLAGVALALVAAAQAQVWEKLLAPGLTYRMEYDAAGPHLVHALRFSLGNPTLKASAELGELKVFSAGPFKGRETIGMLVKRSGAKAD